MHGGGRADALLDVDPVEHARRQSVGLNAVTDAWLLDVLLNFPLDQPVSTADLTEGELLAVERAPRGVFGFGHGVVRRALTKAARVVKVQVRAAGWRTGLRRAAAFEPFAQRELVLPRIPAKSSDLLWRAEMLGIGVRVESTKASDDDVVLPCAPWSQERVSAGGWRFAERAYGCWISGAHHPE